MQEPGSTTFLSKNVQRRGLSFSYKGEAYFVEAEAVCDNGILTANGFGALELAKEILRLLKFRSEQELAEWYAWNKFGLYSPGHKGRTPSGL